MDFFTSSALPLQPQARLTHCPTMSQRATIELRVLHAGLMYSTSLTLIRICGVDEDLKKVTGLILIRGISIQSRIKPNHKWSHSHDNLGSALISKHHKKDGFFLYNFFIWCLEVQKSYSKAEFSVIRLM